MELTARTAVASFAKLQEVSAKQDELITTLNQRIDNQQQQIQNEEASSFLSKILYGVAGLGVGYLIGHGSK